MTRCPWCRKSFKQKPRGRPRIYCCNAHKIAAFRARELARAEEAGREAGREEAIEQGRDRRVIV